MKQDEFLKLLGARVTTIRSYAKLTQLQLAKRVRLTRAQITNIEAGRVNVPIWTLARIAAACNYDLSELLKR